MTYKLQKPYKETERLDFIVEYNHKKGLKIEETETALYALEPWETLEGDTIIDNSEEYEAEQVQAERERVNMLFLTGTDVERAFYKDKGMDFDDLLKFVESNPPENLDVKALKIELKANNFYRGNPYIDAVGKMLGYSMEDLDHLFETGSLPENEEETEEENEVKDEE